MPRRVALVAAVLPLHVVFADGKIGHVEVVLQVLPWLPFGIGRSIESLLTPASFAIPSAGLLAVTDE